MNTELIKLDEGEQILKVVRKHWFILFSHMSGVIIAGCMPFAALVLWASSDTVASLISHAHLGEVGVSFAVGAWSLIVFITAHVVWADYYLDMWIITNRRLISIDQQGFFRRSVSSFRFERLQDVTVTIKGIIQTLLDFGSISADTAGHDPFEVYGLPNPRSIKSLILEHADQAFTKESLNKNAGL